VWFSVISCRSHRWDRRWLDVCKVAPNTPNTRGGNLVDKVVKWPISLSCGYNLHRMDWVCDKIILPKIERSVCEWLNADQRCSFHRSETQKIVNPWIWENYSLFKQTWILSTKVLGCLVTHNQKWSSVTSCYINSSKWGKQKEIIVQFLVLSTIIMNSNIYKSISVKSISPKKTGNEIQNIHK